MKNNDDSFFAEPVDPKQEARFLALEMIPWLLIWMAEGKSIKEGGVRARGPLHEEQLHAQLSPRSTSLTSRQ